MNIKDPPAASATSPARAHANAVDADSPTLRAFAVVEAVGRSGRPMLLMDVVAAVSLPKATVHRILTQLVEGGLLRRLPGAGARASMKQPTCWPARNSRSSCPVAA